MHATLPNPSFSRHGREELWSASRWCACLHVCVGRVPCVQALVSVVELLGAQPSDVAADAIRAFGERVCADGWRGSLACHSCTFLAPHRYWYRRGADGELRRGTIAAVFPCEKPDHVLMDAALDGVYDAARVVDVVSATKQQGAPRVPGLAADPAFQPSPGPVPCLAFVKHLAAHGYASVVVGHGPVAFPPRRVVAQDASGASTPGWLVGWDPSAGAYLVAPGLYPDPSHGSAGDLLSRGRAALLLATPDCVAAANPSVAADRLAGLHALLSSQTGKGVVSVGPWPVTVPQPRWSMPGADLKHLPATRNGAVACPGDVGKLFAASSMVSHMDVRDPRKWDTSGAIPALECCKRLRDALPGADRLIVLPLRCEGWRVLPFHSTGVFPVLFCVDFFDTLLCDAPLVRLGGGSSASRL
jgi:hypothetical protein